MKRLRSLLLPLLLLTSAAGPLWATGIDFVDLSWEAALARAKVENKAVFLDAYTVWCGPCKKMDREVFPEAAVGEYFNQHFISVKINMEKGEGPQVARQYRVRAYPTLIFVAADGEMLHQAAGYHDAQQLLEVGQRALDPNKRMGALKKRFDEGDREPDFLLDYTYTLADVHDGSHLPVAEAYLATQSDWTTEPHLEMIFQLLTDANSPLFDYLVEHKADFIAHFGERAVVGRIQELIYQTVYDTEEESSLEQVDRLFAKAYPEKAERLSANFRMSFYRQAGDRQNYAKAAVDYFNSFPEAGSDELNDVAWTFYQVIDDVKLLRKAAKWAKRSVKLDPQYYNNDTLAGIYQKMGKEKAAIKAAKAAIEIAKQTGEDYSKTAALLEELNAE